ncbi:MAG: ATP-dependent Clp protease ATP-binding subunit [Bdellovibrionales bacterium]|nr:ATP-dependent Clp protease ATP-binding subunit [Bdellovibrionales bacterium]
MKIGGREESPWGAFELCWYAAWSLVLAILYYRFSSDSWLGPYPWAGAVLIVYLVNVAVALDGQDTFAKGARFLAPTIFLYLFYSQAGGSVAELQARISFGHFVLVLLAAVGAAIVTQHKSAPRTANSLPAPSEDRDPQPRPVATRTSSDPFKRIIGQPHVLLPLREIAEMVRAGIRVGKRNAPHAVLLFLGPTGVGKTEAARALTEAIFGTPDALIRFDMGQFTDAHQANRFYGPPPGYVGSDKGGQLTQAVLKRPHAVVLLDEVEKADPQIWDAFLPVFDEGYVVDGSFNKKVDMTNTVIVLTSNLLSSQPYINTLAPVELKEALEATGAFRPELIGRINEILVFNALDATAIREILKQRLDAALWSLSEQGISITVDELEIQSLVQQVQEAKFGVRQIDDVVRGFLRRAIAQHRGEA